MKYILGKYKEIYQSHFLPSITSSYHNEWAVDNLHNLLAKKSREKCDHLPKPLLPISKETINVHYATLCNDELDPS